MANATIKLRVNTTVREIACVVAGAGFTFTVTSPEFTGDTVTFNLESGWIVDDLVAALMNTGYFIDDPEIDPEEAGAEPGGLIAGTYVGSAGASTRPGEERIVSLSIPITYTP